MTKRAFVDKQTFFCWLQVWIVDKHEGIRRGGLWHPSGYCDLSSDETASALLSVCLHSSGLHRERMKCCLGGSESFSCIVAL